MIEWEITSRNVNRYSEGRLKSSVVSIKVKRVSWSDTGADCLKFRDWGWASFTPCTLGVAAAAPFFFSVGEEWVCGFVAVWKNLPPYHLSFFDRWTANNPTHIHTAIAPRQTIHSVSRNILLIHQTETPVHYSIAHLSIARIINPSQQPPPHLQILRWFTSSSNPHSNSALLSLPSFSRSHPFIKPRSYPVKLLLSLLAAKLLSIPRSIHHSNPRQYISLLIYWDKTTTRHKSSQPTGWPVQLISEAITVDTPIHQADRTIHSAPLCLIGREIIPSFTYQFYHVWFIKRSTLFRRNSLGPVLRFYWFYYFSLGNRGVWVYCCSPDKMWIAYNILFSILNSI